jgi:patatin-like phospholipase/acyl hydrolase
LAKIEDAIDGKVVEHFDLITGTSTGGILALGLGLGQSAESMLGFYQEKAAKIFPSTGVRAMVRQVVRPKHAAKICTVSSRKYLGTESWVNHGGRW